MKIISGLGNPGKEYENTRHNAGFYFLEKIRNEWGFPEFEFNRKFNAEISRGEKNGEVFLLIRPRTFMNLSGTALRAVLDFYKLAPEDLLVIHDDLDIDLGKFKLAKDSSSAGHKGVENVIENLGTQKFRRLRIGVKTKKLKNPAAPEEFVLEKMPEEEIKKLDGVFKEAKNYLNN